MATGTCRLTGKSGTFVKAHLLPRALTRAGRTRGEKFIEHGLDAARPLHRASSWYDQELVIREGEAILERHDTAGISELRRIGAIWSSPAHGTLVPRNVNPDTRAGDCDLLSLHPKRLRLFVLSLLWRATATDLPEFSRTRMPLDDLEYLRTLVASGDIGSRKEFPIFFMCLLGPGAEHNHTPIRQLYGEHGGSIEVYRFYLDGLLIFVGDRNPASALLRDAHRYLVGFDKHFAAMAAPFDGSRQERDLVDVMVDMMGRG